MEEIEQLKKVYKEIKTEINNGNPLIVKGIVEYFLGENNVSIDRIMLDVLKDYRDLKTYKPLYEKCLSAVQNKIGKIN